MSKCLYCKTDLEWLSQSYEFEENVMKVYTHYKCPGCAWKKTEHTLDVKMTKEDCDE